MQNHKKSTVPFFQIYYFFFNNLLHASFKVKHFTNTFRCADKKILKNPSLSWMYLFKNKKQLIPSVPQTTLVLSDFSALTTYIQIWISPISRQKPHWRWSFGPLLCLQKLFYILVGNFCCASTPARRWKVSHFPLCSLGKMPVQEALSKFYRTKQ